MNRVIGDMSVFVSREHERAKRERHNIHKYQECCNRAYPSFSLSTYEPNPIPETESDLRTGIGNVLDMQSDETPDLRSAMDAPTRGNARLRGRQFLLWFATNPPSDPDAFRVTAENAYQIFRAIGHQERPDHMLLRLTELLTGLLADNAETTRARRASLQVAFLLLEVIRTLRTRLAQSRAPSRESGEILVRFSKFISDMSDAGNTADTFGRICVEVARVHAGLAARGRRRQEAGSSSTQDIIAECLRRASYLHPNLPVVLDKMDEQERRNLLSMMTGESVDDIDAKELS